MTRTGIRRAKVRGRLTLVALCLLAAACAPTETPADTTGSLAGQTVRLIVGPGAGGGQDLHARVLAPFLSRHLPGRPSVVVANMPGAGGLVAVNHLARGVRADGLTIGLVSVLAPIAQLREDPGARFDVRLFPAIGAPVTDTAVCVMSRSSGIDWPAWRDGTREPRLGVTNYGALTHLDAVLFSASLRLGHRLIVGYKGTADIRMAMESGEVDGVCLTESAFVATFRPASNYRVVLRSSETGEVEADPGPDAERPALDPEGRALMQILALAHSLPQYYAAPPGTPPARVAMLRRAFDAAMKDEDFLATAAAARLDIRPVEAAEVDRRIAQLLAPPAQLRQRLLDLLQER